MDQLTDDDLMTMYADGDADAFDVLFSRHHTSVYNFACMMLHDAHRAEDVLQETFLAVINAAQRYRQEGYFRTWLLRICRNRCLNLLDADRTRRALMAETGFRLVEATSPVGSPAQRTDSRERLRKVRDGIQCLPERQREAMVLFAFENMKYRDIADVLGTPVNTVKTLIHRSRSALAQMLADNQGAET